MIKLNNLLNEETFTATNKKTGKTSVFKSKDSRDSAIKAGTHSKADDKGGDTSKKASTPTANIFNTPAAEPKKDEPTSEPKKKRPGNPQVNKATKSKAEELGVTPQKLGNKEYPLRMLQAAYEALTDSNYHSEARELIAKIEGKPEMAEKPEYPSMRDPNYEEKMKAISQKYASKYSDDVDDNARELGIAASQEAGWGGVEAADAIAFTLRMNGFHKEADLIQSVFDNKPYMKNEGRISLTKMVLEISSIDGLNDILNGQSSQIEGIKISKDMAEHIIYWMRTSPYGKKYNSWVKKNSISTILPIAFNWGLDRGLPSELKNEFTALKAKYGKAVKKENTK